MQTTKCDFCNKTIEGYSKKHVDYLMLQHVISKHKEVMVNGNRDSK